MGGKPLAGQFFVADKEAEDEDHQRCSFPHTKKRRWQYSRFVEVMRGYKETAELTNEVIVEMLFKELTREEDLEISRLDGYDEGCAISENISDAEKIYQNY